MTFDAAHAFHSVCKIQESIKILTCKHPNYIYLPEKPSMSLVILSGNDFSSKEPCIPVNATAYSADFNISVIRSASMSSFSTESKYSAVRFASSTTLFSKLLKQNGLSILSESRIAFQQMSWNVASPVGDQAIYKYLYFKIHAQATVVNCTNTLSSFKAGLDSNDSVDYVMHPCSFSNGGTINLILTLTLTAPDIHCAQFLPLSLSYLAYSHFSPQALLSAALEWLLCCKVMQDLCNAACCEWHCWSIEWVPIG